MTLKDIWKAYRANTTLLKLKGSLSFFLDSIANESEFGDGLQLTGCQP